MPDPKNPPPFFYQSQDFVAPARVFSGEDASPSAADVLASPLTRPVGQPTSVRKALGQALVPRPINNGTAGSFYAQGLNSRARLNQAAPALITQVGYGNQPQSNRLSAAQMQVRNGNLGAIPMQQQFAPAGLLANYRSAQVPAPATPYVAPYINAPLPVPKAPGKLGLAVKSGLNSVGAGIKANPLGALNGALGLAGALEYATAKAPEMPGRPAPYQPGVRAAQGLNVTALEAGRRQIQSAQLQAGRATGADVGTTAATRLMAQQQAGEQQGMLSIKDNEAFQQDQRRVDEQQRSDYQANYQTQRSYDEKKYDLQQRQFEARRQQGAGMSQAALTYFNQDRADRINQEENLKLSAIYAKIGIARPENRTKKKATTTTTSTNESEVEVKAKGGQLLLAELHARGGTLKIKTKASFGGRGVQARAGKAFEERMDTITSQAMAAFHATLREASNKRAKGLSGR